MPIYAGTAACATWEAIALTEDAAAAGADAAILTPPFYFGIPDEMLHGFFADVAAAGVLPVVVYNNPLYTGNALSPALIAELMELDNVIGLKQSETTSASWSRRCGSAEHRAARSAPASTASSTRRSASAPAASSRPRRRSSRARSSAVRPRAGRRPRRCAPSSTACCSRSTASWSTTRATSRRPRRRSSSWASLRARASAAARLPRARAPGAPRGPDGARRARGRVPA